MSLETRLNSLVTAIGTDIKNLRDTRGNLASLTTTNKANLVAALNELKGLIDNVSPGSVIDDTQTLTTKTWSSDKITTHVTAAIAAVINAAPTALDTLNELAAALANDANFASTINTALGLRVSVDAAQTFTAAQKLQGRQNIDAASNTDFQALVTGIGDYDANLLQAYEAARDAI